METIALRFSFLCWGIFFLFWLISALRTKPTARSESLGDALFYRLFAVLAFFLLCDAPRLPSPLSLAAFPHRDWLSVLSMGTSLLGLVVCLWARITLGRNWSSIVVVKVDHELVRHGPYRFVRHPIYTGMLLLFGANVLLSGRVASLVGLAFLTASFILKLRREEEFMLKVFPGEYPAYMKQVKRLVPFLY